MYAKTEKQILSLKSDNDFNRVYRMYFARCLRFAAKCTGSREDAENLVQDVFLFLWENRQTIVFHSSFNLWVFKVLKNKCIDFMRRKIAAEMGKKRLQDNFMIEFEARLKSLELFDDDLVSDDEQLSAAINKAIDSLPEQCRKIFIMSKIEGKKYDRIASELGLTRQTVANQMSIALKKLREQLKDYAPLLIFAGIF